MTTITEKRRFQMNPKLLLDVMKRQAGTISKAILEGVMNSVDAKATECRITTDAEHVMIEDDGQGFRNRQEIETWFEVFGQPHEESEAKTFGTFRMGRGQMFAFGANRWRTGRFTMLVDVDKHGLDYELLDVPESHKGCRIMIDLYNQLMPSDLAEIERNLESWVRYCQIPVYLNGQRLSIDPKTEKWDHVTDEAYIRLKPTGMLAVYNLGIHVLDLGAYRYGTGGVLVSRKQLKVNFARNDIQSDCPVWKIAKVLVDKSASEKIVRKKAMTDDERQRLVDRFLQGLMTYDEISTIAVITAATGRQYTLDQVSFPHEFPQLTNAPKGSRKADIVMRSKVAFVIADETMERFHVKNVEALAQLLSERTNETYIQKRWQKRKITDFNELAAGLASDCEVLEEKDLNPREQLWLGLLNKGLHRLISEEARHALGRAGVFCRRVHVGVSDVSAGWTDGETYICVSRKFLSDTEFDVQGFIKAGNLLLHGLCHHASDLEEHDHDQAFYEEFHENADLVGNFAAYLLSCLPQYCATLKRRMTKAALRSQDHLVQATASLGSVGLASERDYAENEES